MLVKRGTGTLRRGWDGMEGPGKYIIYCVVLVARWLYVGVVLCE